MRATAPRALRSIREARPDALLEDEQQVARLPRRGAR